MMQIEKLLQTIRQFNEERGWGTHHQPVHLAMSISIEAAELLENYQWGEEYADEQNVKEELADIFIYALMLADKQQLDVEQIIREKIQKNAEKYPVI